MIVSNCAGDGGTWFTDWWQSLDGADYHPKRPPQQINIRAGQRVDMVQVESLNHEDPPRGGSSCSSCSDPLLGPLRGQARQQRGRAAAQTPAVRRGPRGEPQHCLSLHGHGQHHDLVCVRCE